ncbi:MAG: palindromic element RPE1 domain-containing protein, partial [Rickettsia aeschlimannii]
NTEHSTAAYIKVREDASTGLTYKLPLEGGYARSLVPIINCKSNLLLEVNLLYIKTYQRYNYLCKDI